MTTRQPPRVAPSLWARVKSRLQAGEWGPLPVLIGLVLIWAFFQTQNQNFLTPRNLSNLILQIGVTGTIGIGMVMILVLGEIDLSLGAVSGVCAGVLGVLMAQNHWSGPAAILAAVLVGGLIGVLQGSIIVFVGVPAFIVTLAGYLAWQGVQIILLGSVGELLVQDPFIRGLASDYLSIPASIVLTAVIIAGAAALILSHRARRVRAGLKAPTFSVSAVQVGGFAVAVAALTAWLDSYFGVPYILVILLSLMGLLTWLMSRTVFGRHLYAIGGNAEAARRAGVPVGASRIAVFAIASALAGLAGVLSASRQFAVSTGTGGGTLLLESIAAAVIGGTSLFGGRGQIFNALLGALVIGSVENGLDLLGQPSSTKDIATGIILIVAVSVDALSRRQQAQK